MPPKGKKPIIKASPLVTGKPSSSNPSFVDRPQQNPSVAHPLAPLFTHSTPDRGFSPSKRSRADTITPPPAPAAPSQTNLDIVAEELILQGVVLKGTAGILHIFLVWCEPLMSKQRKEIEALKAEIETLRLEIEVILETMLITQDEQEAAKETKPAPCHE
ncbi:hypothetical protein Q9L58_008116 [Maublancomyces gigas]|uniref:Uncharacterized protein n=1 Tax=Discina gigas TaxID=1032678 RepID=A0ABR3GB64_9PEZI